MIHPTAVVSPNVVLGPGVEIGPYVVVGEEVALGHGTKVGPHAVIENWTTAGEGCTIGAGAVVGGAPQDVKFCGHRSFVRIGHGTVVREYVTIHRSREPDGETLVGKNCYLMAFSHVAHDCHLGDGVVLVNLAALSGHVVAGDGAFISGNVAVHQFVRLGELCLVGAFSAVRKDILPFTIVEGHEPRVRGLNVVGLKRRGVSSGARGAIKRAMNILLDEGLRTVEAVNRIQEQYGEVPEVNRLVSFVENSERGFYR
ncbi:MAG: acyl-ACP--UDP-N-acetylglucosamine O-acyltransferase [Nitrospinota bacterium]